MQQPRPRQMSRARRPTTAPNGSGRGMPKTTPASPTRTPPTPPTPPPPPAPLPLPTPTVPLTPLKPPTGRTASPTGVLRMPNMGHCRFRNTAQDLRDVIVAWFETDLSTEEQEARVRIYRMAREIAEQDEPQVNAESEDDA